MAYSTGTESCRWPVLSTKGLYHIWAQTPARVACAPLPVPGGRPGPGGSGYPGGGAPHGLEGRRRSASHQQALELLAVECLPPAPASSTPAAAGAARDGAAGGRTRRLDRHQTVRPGERLAAGAGKARPTAGRPVRSGWGAPATGDRYGSGRWNFQSLVRRRTAEQVAAEVASRGAGGAGSPALAVCAGRRQGELLRLTWDNVDLEAGTIRVLGGSASKPPA